MGHSSQALVFCKWKGWTTAGILGSQKRPGSSSGTVKKTKKLKSIIKLPSLAELLIGTDLFTRKSAQKKRLLRCLREQDMSRHLSWEAS